MRPSSATNAPLRLVNLTTHPVVVQVGDDNPIAAWPASGAFARIVEEVSAPTGMDTDQGFVPVSLVRYADTVEGLPGKVSGTAYLVSRVLAAAVPRDDLYFPLDEVRDATGRIIGCRALGQFDHSHTEERGDA